VIPFSDRAVGFQGLTENTADQKGRLIQLLSWILLKVL
jgi:hypothetical protein